MKTCPVCRQKWNTARPRRQRMAVRLERVGAEWAVVADGASRYYIGKLARRYPGWEFRHKRISLVGGAHGRWRIEAKRRA